MMGKEMALFSLPRSQHSAKLAVFSRTDFLRPIPCIKRAVLYYSANWWRHFFASFIFLAIVTEKYPLSQRA